MVPSGKVTDDTVAALQSLLEKGDTIIDGGNSNYHDSIARAASSAERGISFIDAGTSGGIWGLQVGYCLMAGGEKETSITGARSSRRSRRPTASCTSVRQAPDIS